MFIRIHLSKVMAFGQQKTLSICQNKTFLLLLKLKCCLFRLGIIGVKLCIQLSCHILIHLENLITQCITCTLQDGCVLYMRLSLLSDCKT